MRDHYGRYSGATDIGGKEVMVSERTLPQPPYHRQTLTPATMAATEQMEVAGDEGGATGIIRTMRRARAQWR